MPDSLSSRDIEGHSALARAAVVSLILAFVKLVGFFLSGSILVLASLFDSLGDAVLSTINSRLNRMAIEAPDREHPFGHGGIEVLGALTQGFVLTFLALLLLVESARRLASHPGVSRFDPEYTWVGIAVLVLSACFALVIHRYLVAKAEAVKANKQRSLALGADSAHYEIDFYTNMASAAGLALVWMTGWPLLDGVFGMVAAGLSFRAALPIIRDSIRDILNEPASPERQQEIVDMIYACDERILGLHRLRTRQLGPTLFIDFHLKLDRKMSLEIAHDIGDEVAAKIRSQIPRADVIIHLDPDSEPDDDIWTPSYQTSSKPPKPL